MYNYWIVDREGYGKGHGQDLLEENILRSFCRAGDRNPSLQGEIPCKCSAESSSAFCLCMFCPRVPVPFAEQNGAAGILSFCSANRRAVGTLPVDFRAG